MYLGFFSKISSLPTKFFVIFRLCGKQENQHLFFWLVVFFLKMASRGQIDYPDYPKKTEFSSKEDYEEAVKKFFKVKGFRLIEEFSDNEKKVIAEDCGVKLISPKVLSQEYNTMIHVICYICREMGFSAAPNDLAEYPDYPKKSEDMSIEEYQKITKKYWKNRVTKTKQEKKRAARELRVQQILENLIPKDLTEHPDFPEKLVDDSPEQYAEKIDKYWIDQRKNKLKRKMTGKVVLRTNGGIPYSLYYKTHLYKILRLWCDFNSSF